MILHGLQGRLWFSARPSDAAGRDAPRALLRPATKSGGATRRGAVHATGVPRKGVMFQNWEASTTMVPSPLKPKLTGHPQKMLFGLDLLEVLGDIGALVLRALDYSAEKTSFERVMLQKKPRELGTQCWDATPRELPPRQLHVLQGRAHTCTCVVQSTFYRIDERSVHTHV